MLEYKCFKKNYKKIRIDLSKLQKPDVNPKAIQHFNFAENLCGNNNALIFFITEEEKETISGFSQGTVKIM